MSGLSSERRDELEAAVREADVRGVGAIVDAIEPLIAGWLAAEREAGAAEVRARVEELEPTWPRGMYGCPDDMFSRRDLRAALNGGE